jgi:uncharacterized protein YdbL (DUF1318 family)
MLAALSAITAIAVVGCVIRTEHRIEAHIQVDVRYIEEQAGSVLDFIEGDSDELEGFDGSTLDTTPNRGMEGLVDWLRPIQIAHAQALKTDSAKTRELAEKMRARYKEIAAVKKTGCMGEDNRGYVELFDCAAIEEGEKRNAAQKLKTAENQDRKALYNEFAKLNAEGNVTVAQIEAIFAKQRLERAKAGEKFQLPKEGPVFDAFKESEKGKALGEECVAEAWVTIK